MVDYEDLSRDPETGVPHAKIEDPRQRHEWMEYVVSDVAVPPHRMPCETTGGIEILDVRTWFYDAH